MQHPKLLPISNMRTYIQLLIGIFMLFAVHAQAQTDSTHKKKPITNHLKIPPNSTKLELVYKEALITQYNTNTGASRSYNVFTPYVRVNDAKPVEIGKHAEFLRSFFSRCSEADEQIDLMNQQSRRAKLDFLAGIGAGAVIAFSGMIPKSDGTLPGATSFFTHFGIGAVVMGTGAYFAHMHAKKADEHLRLSVDIYNSRCFKPLPADTNSPATAANTPQQEKPVVPSAPKLYRDTTLYSLLRNDPSHSGMFGLLLVPISINGSYLNLNASGGLGFFYTYESMFGISATYQRAYIDDVAGNDKDNIPAGTADSWGIPANYHKSSNLDIRTKLTAVSWEKEGTYNLHLANTRNGEVVGETKGTIFHAITARLGYQLDNRLIESSTQGINFVNSTPVYNYNYEGQTYPLTPTDLQTSSTMVKSGIVAAGIGYSTFRDIKIELHDDTYHGRREERSQSDLYFDVLYAQSIKVEDMIYYYSEEQTPGAGHLPQRLDVSKTPVNKLGFRVGTETIACNQPHFGWKVLIEAGMRPGPQTIDKQEPFYLLLTIGMAFGGRISTSN